MLEHINLELTKLAACKKIMLWNLSSTSGLFLSEINTTLICTHKKNGQQFHHSNAQGCKCIDS